MHLRTELIFHRFFRQLIYILLSTRYLFCFPYSMRPPFKFDFKSIDQIRRLSLTPNGNLCSIRKFQSKTSRLMPFLSFKPSVHTRIYSSRNSYSSHLMNGNPNSPLVNRQQIRLFSFIKEDVKEILRQHSSHPNYNIPDNIVDKIGRNLHLQPYHPLNIIKKRIEDFCVDYARRHQQMKFEIHDNLSPVVDTQSCFDELRVEKDHVSRRPSDTYYISDTQLLRTHTSAHQCTLMRQSHPETSSRAFLCTGDVYRRDEIDASHYPVFHQMEGVRVFDKSELPAQATEVEIKQFIEKDLKGLLSELARHLFGDVEMRWREDYFPFTEPSFELEVLFGEEDGASGGSSEKRWMEVLGCGVIHPDVMRNAGRGDQYGWAFGLGLERLAMVLFSIPDIRLFWSNDERFLKQFKPPSQSKTEAGNFSASADSQSIDEDSYGRPIKFVPYSKYPLCYKDVSFWIPETTSNNAFHSNDLYELVRDLAGDLVEKVELIDEFTHPKTQRVSHAYRITYRHMDKSLTNEEVDKVQFAVRDELVRRLGVSLR